MRPTDGAGTEASGRGAGRAPRSPRDPPLAGPASLGFWAVTGAVFLPGSLAEGEGRRGLSGSQSLPLVCPSAFQGGSVAQCSLEAGPPGHYPGNSAEPRACLSFWPERHKPAASWRPGSSPCASSSSSAHCSPRGKTHRKSQSRGPGLAELAEGQSAPTLDAPHSDRETGAVQASLPAGLSAKGQLGGQAPSPPGLSVLLGPSAPARGSSKLGHRACLPPVSRAEQSPARERAQLADKA